MSRLIDADLLEEILDVNIQILQNNIDDATTEVQKLVYEAQEFSTMEMIRVIKEQPTAFDVDKVCEELQSYKDDIRQWNDTYTSGQISAYEKAIAVVKAGGRDERNI